MSSSLLAVQLIISIALIIFLIVIPKLNPAISLVIASIYMGITCGLGAPETLAIVGTGFGNMMTSIGLPIGFGVIMGQLMDDTGTARKIARTIVSVVPQRFSLYAMAFTAFLIAIPVFFDVTFIILVPIGIAVVKVINKSMAYVTGALTIGTGIAHTLVPPTPNPLAAPDIFKFDLGVMMTAGLVIGAIATVIALSAYTFIHNRGIFKASDVSFDVAEANEAKAAEESDISFFLSLLPILVPIVCILAGTVAGAFSDDIPMFIRVISNKIFALLLGTLAAYYLGYRYLGRKRSEESANEAVKIAGVAMLITGAGGSFGAIIAATDIGNALVSAMKINTTSVLSVLFLGYAIGAVFRIAQGSGTVAGITSMSIMATIAPNVAVHPVYIALACLAGGISIGHINDSGFWVVTNLSGFTVTGGLKTYTLAQILMSISIMILVVLGAVILPMAPLAA